MARESAYAQNMRNLCQLPGFRDVVSKGNALAFVENEKTIDSPDLPAQCLVILAPSSGISWIVISREGFFWITMDFRGPRSMRFVMGFWGVCYDCRDPPFLGRATVEVLGCTQGTILQAPPGVPRASRPAPGALVALALSGPTGVALG